MKDVDDEDDGNEDLDDNDEMVSTDKELEDEDY